MTSLAWRIEKESVVDSTNDLVLERARQGEPEGLVIHALAQRKGRGRQGRYWLSPPGCGLYFSILLRPSLPAELITQMSLVAGVSAAEGLSKSTGVHVRLKWPNDLRIESKKTGGILCEFENSGDGLPALVIGIGVNLKTPPSGYPANLRTQATSIEEEGGQVGDFDAAIHSILERLKHWYQSFLSNGFSGIQSRWLGLCDNLGEMVQVSTGTDFIQGCICGLNHKGHLLVKTASGDVRAFDSGEVATL